MLSMNNISKSAAGFFVGGMIAAAVALLYAPQSGEETRREIGERAMQTRQQAQQAISGAKAHLVESVEELQGRTQKLLKNVEEEITHKGTRLKSIASNEENEQMSSLESSADDAMLEMNA